MSKLEDISNKTQKSCPICGQLIPENHGYVSWCDQCDWNLQPLKPDNPMNIFESFYGRLGQRQSQRLFENLKKSGSLKSSLTLANIIAYLASALIYGILLLFLIVGLTLLLRGWGDFLRIVTIIMGIICLSIVFASIPRPAKSRRPPVDKESFPQLFKLIDLISNYLASSPLDGMILTPGFSAGIVRLGWSQKRYIVLGYALWSILNNQERIALLAHEIAHYVNGDLSRKFFVGSAIGVLINWYTLIIPDKLVDTSGLIGLILTPFNFILYGLAKLVQFAVLGMFHLLWQDSQRAEYLADYLSAQIAGTDAMLNTLEKTYYSKSFFMAVQNVALTSANEQKDLFEVLQQRIEALPDRELERIRRIEMMEGSRLNVTHPPTPLRVELLKHHFIDEPKIEAKSVDFELIDRELAAVQDGLAEELKESYLAFISR